MDKLKILVDFESFLKKRFPGRDKPIIRDVEVLQPKSFNDHRFNEWRKNK
ncbi:MAG: hypothetical protein II997_09565 [Clostridia bacterium]|nr:hypothetical protein [Clostridia bacterium]